MTAPAAPISKRELELRRRHKQDLLYYAPRCLVIKTKAGGLVRLRINKPQEYLHSRLEDQLRRTGRVRALILKGRQQGCSTYVEARFFHKVTHRKGMKAFILAHLDTASTNIFEMAKRFYDYLPLTLKPTPRASNGKVLAFDKLDSGYRIGTAENKNSGRSETIQLFHGSEVAFWPYGSEIMRGALQAVPNARGTEIILESTANGPKDMFATLCLAALEDEQRVSEGKRPRSQFELIFIPWFWSEEYRLPVHGDFELDSEEEAYADRHGLDDEQIAWRRDKIIELEGVHNFRREYPATPQEAFAAEVPGALWTREIIKATRHPAGEPLPHFKRIAVGVDPSGGDGPQNDEQGIVAGGITHSDDIYILTDASCKLDPNGWGSRAVGTYEKWLADIVVAEQNFGGAMVKSTIQTVDPRVPVLLITASRGKQQRAEPVSALYAQGKVHHVGPLAALEDEMVTWVPGESKWSPNRMDAMVWVVFELFLKGKKPPKPAKPPVVGQGNPFSV